MKGCSVEGCSGKHKGLGFCVKHYTKFKRFGDAYGGKTYRPRGTGNINSCGYVRNSQKFEHIEVAERIFGGSLPSGYVVHHKDRNRLNNSADNLVICKSQKEHIELHRQEKALAECGNPMWKRCAYCKTYADPSGMKSYKAGRYLYHPECVKLENKKRVQRKKETPK